MIKRLLPLFLFVWVIACNNPAPRIGYKIFGNITDLPDGNVFLKRYIDGEWKAVDSTVSQGGNFTFTGHVDMPEMYRVVISDTLPYISVFVDNHEINIESSKTGLTSARISGSKVQEEYEAFWGTQKSTTSKLDSVYNVYKNAQKNNNTALMQRNDSLYEALSIALSKAVKKYVLSNKSSVVSAYLTWSKLVHEIELKELDSITNTFDATVKKTVYVKMLKEYIDVLKKVEVGQPAVDFTMNTPEGKPLKLSSLYGKYLLIDFWASWCQPCRQENPNVVAVYKKYSHKGFDILGVSLDKKKDAWLEAIKADKLTWHHVSDLKFWSNEAAKTYGVRSIPSNVLIDPKGIIIAKNLKGEELDHKLQLLLEKPKGKKKKR
ncbi:MAG: TlpA disulfide reductase family protein [Bacteroidota bacterium]|nr:TlpA disulfide reductase family protein [Bacteroidota bacterium]